MGRRFLLIIILMGATLVGWAQNEKYTPSTLMFLSEQRGETTLPQVNKKVPLTFVAPPQFGDEELAKIKSLGKRKIAEAELVNGTKMISAFIAVKNNNFSGLESLGVVFEAKFKNLATTLIPVDKIEEVAKLDNVTRIEVAEILQPCNDKQREATKAGDAISNSAAAQALGLSKQYTGKGVILGIVDTGVDFQHVAFKDKSGNSRIVRAYKLSGSNSTSLTTYSSASQISGLTYDTNEEDHGTHTSTTAGGSSVIVNGNNVTVTDDHANATYGGMAPEADLVIAGLSSLYTTSIATAIQNICNYADQVGKPCVISLSLGSQQGPHDGTGSVANVINQYAGNNHIIVYAASNDGMRADYFVQAGTSNGGGCYASGNASNSKPMLINLQKAWTNADGNVQLYASSITAYARTAGTAISMKFRVVDTTTGDVVYSSNAYSSSSTISMTGTSGLAQYFKSQSGYYNPYGDNATIRIIRGQDSYSNKYYFSIYTPVLISTSYNDEDGDGIYNSKYALCLSFYPTSGSTVVDVWDGGQVCWFGNDLTLSSNYANGYNVVKGNDECSVSDDACNPKVISVGAYVTKNAITDYAGTTHDWSEDYPNIGDHASFSSWQTAGYGPLGTALPHINAPGARIVAGINSYHTKSVDADYSYWGDNFIGDLVVNNTNHAAYAAMEGTSMATPCVSGIVAQWLQACVEAGKTPTPDYIKEVMAATWDTDQWTNGTGSGAHGAKTFGTHGKINAIKGIQYILGVSGGPTITANPDQLSFTGYAGETYTKTVTVKGISLEGNISVTKSGDAFTVDKTSITQTGGTAQADITITWKPTAASTQKGTITLSSPNAETVTINITGTVVAPELIAVNETVSLTAEAGLTAKGKFGVLGANLKDNVTATLNDANNVFSIDATTITKADAEEGKDINVMFSPTTVGNYTATVTLSSPNVEDVIVTLNGTATAPVPTLTVSEQVLTFSADVNSAQTKTVTLSGRALSGDITISLTDNAGVFSVNPTTIAAADIASNPVVSVTFNASEEATYTGTLTISSEGLEDIIINLSATASDGGTASDPYLNIAKYATIDDAGWSKATSGTPTGVTNLYKYTEYPDAEVAWLTLSVYGAWVGVYSNNHPQKWIESSLGTSNAYASTSWTYSATATDPYQGWNSYFDKTSNWGTGTRARVIGYNSRNNTDIKSVSFYVTNTKAVKLLGMGANGANSQYPASIKVYECTKNTNGSLTASSTVVKSATSTSTSTSTAFNIGVSDLDASKIYKVEASVYRGYLYEIGFQTSLKEPELIADPEEIEFSTIVGTPVTKTFEVLGSDLLGEVTATLNDENGVYSIDATTITKDEAQEGKTISVTFTPTKVGTYSGSITLSSTKAASVVISLTGSAKLIGDVNRDGKVDIADVTALVDIVLGKDKEEPYKYDHEAADIDGDKDTTITDVTALVNIILNTSPE
ncbi:MAG: S8 family serine peptidase [Prevotella sp.]|nr:S8 family serine peptidase [Prevotella sp.]